MTALAVVATLVTALCIGYHFGQRAGSTPSHWRRRTSRAALCRLLISLAVLITTRRIRQSPLAEFVLPYGAGIRGLKSAVRDYATAGSITWMSALTGTTPKRLRNVRFR